MNSDMNYQVLRNFAGNKIGDVLNDVDFINQYRVAQLVDQRFLAPVGGAHVQPTVGGLLGASVRKVGELAPQVQDACVLEVALTQETREAARKTLTKRLEELSNVEQTH
jgi:hypothetical protein